MQNLEILSKFAPSISSRLSKLDNLVNIKIKVIRKVHDNINQYGFISSSEYRGITPLWADIIDIADSPTGWVSDGIAIYKINEHGIYWKSKTNLVGSYRVCIFGY